MPVGPYKTFGACITAQINKGHDRDSARRICGKIEKNTRQAKKKKHAGKK